MNHDIPVKADDGHAVAPIQSMQVSSVAMLDQIESVERKMLGMPQVDCDVTHHFGKGIYIREVRIPAGTFAIGHYQKTEHLNNVVSGKVLMLTDAGASVRVDAPCVFMSGPGRKVGIVLEDMVWQNIYVTDETDIEALESTFLEKSAAWEEGAAREMQLCLTSNLDRDDFGRMLAEIGIDADTVRSVSENESDQIPFPPGSYKVKVADSPIDGSGLFATGSIAAGEVIAPARVCGMRTPAGRFTNHSGTPNAKMVIDVNGDAYLVAIKEIEGCCGGIDGDEITIDYRQCLDEQRRFQCQE